MCCVVGKGIKSLAAGKRTWLDVAISPRFSCLVVLRSRSSRSLGLLKTYRLAVQSYVLDIFK